MAAPIQPQVIAGVFGPFSGTISAISRTSDLTGKSTHSTTTSGSYKGFSFTVNKSDEKSTAAIGYSKTSGKNVSAKTSFNLNNEGKLTARTGLVTEAKSKGKITANQSYEKGTYKSLDLKAAVQNLDKFVSYIFNPINRYLDDSLKANQDPLCFVAGTTISTVNGPVSIEEIDIGSLVICFTDGSAVDAETMEPRRVTKIFRNITDEWIELRYTNTCGSAKKQEQVLHATPGHLFLNEFGKYEQIQSMLQRGGGTATVVMADGSLSTVKGRSIKYSTETAHLFEQAEGYVTPIEGNTALKPEYKKGWRTYNFEVEEYHTYIAGGIRVHNVSAPTAHEEITASYLAAEKAAIDKSVQQGVPRDYAEALARGKRGIELNGKFGGKDHGYTSSGRSVAVDHAAVDSYQEGHGDYGSSTRGVVESYGYGVAAKGGSLKGALSLGVNEGMKMGLTRDESLQLSRRGYNSFKNDEQFGPAKSKSKSSVGNDEGPGSGRGTGSNSGKESVASRVDAHDAYSNQTSPSFMADQSRSQSKSKSSSKSEKSSNSNASPGEGGDPGGDGGKSPVLVDLDGDGISITEFDHSHIFLDTTDDGLQNRTAWAEGRGAKRVMVHVTSGDNRGALGFRKAEKLLEKVSAQSIGGAFVL